MHALRQYGYHEKVTFSWQKPPGRIVAKMIAKLDHGNFWMYLSRISFIDENNEEFVLTARELEYLVEVQCGGATQHTHTRLQYSG